MADKLIVTFPGVRYSVDCPLLYYAGFCYELKGYDKIEIRTYDVGQADGLADLDTYASLAKNSIKKQLEQVKWEQYKQIVFASKSIGTVLALWLEDEWNLPSVTHILLTPLNQTLPFMEKKRNYQCIVTGTEDSFVDTKKLIQICDKNEYPLTVFDGVGHRLESADDFMENLIRLQKIAELY